MAGETNLAEAQVRPTNHPNKLPLGELLGYRFNVKGFGAVGDNATDDVTKIQAAVDACIAAGGGTVYFPIGNYRISEAITFNNDDEVGIRFLGEITGSLIVATAGFTSGFLLDRSLVTPNNTRAMRIIERLSFIANDGCIRIGSSIGAVIRDCQLSARICITTEDSVGVSSQNTQIQNCLLTGRGNYTGANAIIIGGGGSITGTDVHNQNVAIRAYGDGLYIGGGRIERSAVAHLYGLDSGDNDVGLNGLCVAGHTFEGNWTCIDFAGTVSGFSLGGLYLLGHDDSNAGPTGFTGNPAAKGQEYGLRIRANKAFNGVINGVNVSNWHDIAALSMGDSTNRANIFVVGSSFDQSGGAGADWIAPAEAHTATFLNCNQAPVYTFATLPAVPLEGEEFNISDGDTTTWGATVSGGGTDNILVRYNGTNWTVMGA